MNVTFRRGLVTSPHPRATEAGLAVLREGGNAVEATLAAAAVLTVVAPHFTGLGGDAFWLLSDARGTVKAISGIGQSAVRLPAFDGAIPLRGGASALTTAAAVDAWDQAWHHGHHAWAGTRSWASLFDAAIACALDGVPVSASQRFWCDFRATDRAAWPGFATHFLHGGDTPAPGAWQRQPALAATLRRLADHGPRDFYEGALAHRLSQGLQAAGSPLTAADLRATRAREEAPLRLPYRGGELLTLAPPTQGVTTLQAMALLERLDLSSVDEGSADHFHLMVEAIKQAFIDRDRFIADPEFADVPVARLLSAGHLHGLAQRIDRARAQPWPQPYRHGDTVFLAAADAQGRCAGLLQTLYFDWGSGVVAGDTGVLWHNRGAAFSLRPGHPNVLAPGKRPFHTLNPGLYLRGGRPRLVYGTQGADGQPQTLAAVLTRLIDFGLDPATALARPRFLLGRTFSDSRDSLKIEQDAGADVLAELARRGHEVSPLPAQSPLAGTPGVIRLDEDGTLSGAHDPRGEGCAMGW